MFKQINLKRKEYDIHIFPFVFSNLRMSLDTRLK